MRMSTPRSNRDNYGMFYSAKYPATYRVWCNMKQRCMNTDNPAYSDYGGRGITVCERWMNFENFLEDMGERPKGLTLDRRDNNAGYCRENCRWASTTVQARNSRRAKAITINGETLCIADWLERVGVDYATYKKRMSKYGWTQEKALTTPARAWVRKDEEADKH